MPKSILILGASGHGLVCAEIAELIGFRTIEFADDNFREIHGYPWDVVGEVESVDPSRYDACFVAIGNAPTRERIQRELMGSGMEVATLVHPSAVVSRQASLGHGCAVMAGAVVGPRASLGDGSIVNTCASVDHECRLGNFCHVAVGAHLAGNVELGARAWIGAGATVTNNISVCSDCMVGAGAVVVRDIREPGVYVGVPARMLGGSR